MSGLTIGGGSRPLHRPTTEKREFYPYPNQTRDLIKRETSDAYLTGDGHCALPKYRDHPVICAQAHVNTDHQPDAQARSSNMRVVVADE